MPKPRIIIPTAAADLIELAVEIQDQHTSLAKNSPLTLPDWEEASPQIKDASDVQDKINKMNKDLEKLVQRRNNLIDPIGHFVRSLRDILSGVYRSEMRKLGDFGFQVDDTPKQKKVKPEAVTK